MNGQPVTPREIQRVKNMLARGYGPNESARRLKVPPRRVEVIVRRHVEMPAELILLTHLAAEIGVTASMLRNHNTRGILPARFWGGRLTYTPAQARAVRTHYASHGTGDSAWLTSAQTARELRTDLQHLHRVVRRIAERYSVTIRRMKLKGHSGNVWRYCPEDVARAARCEPVLFRGRPRDHVSSKGLAEMVGAVTVTPMGDWVRRGCPHVRDHLRRLWFRPADVLAWLHTRPPHPATQRAIAHLTASLTGQQAA